MENYPNMDSDNISRRDTVAGKKFQIVNEILMFQHFSDSTSSARHPPPDYNVVNMQRHQYNNNTNHPQITSPDIIWHKRDSPTTSVTNSYSMTPNDDIANDYYSRPPFSSKSTAHLADLKRVSQLTGRFEQQGNFDAQVQINIVLTIVVQNVHQVRRTRDQPPSVVSLQSHKSNIIYQTPINNGVELNAPIDGMLLLFVFPHSIRVICDYCTPNICSLLLLLFCVVQNMPHQHRLSCDEIIHFLMQSLVMRRFRRMT